MNFYILMFQRATLYPNGLIWNNEDLKYKLFNMMLPEWQLAFSNAGYNLPDPNYSYQQLIEYMINQQAIHDARSKLTKHQQRKAAMVKIIMIC